MSENVKTADIVVEAEKREVKTVREIALEGTQGIIPNAERLMGHNTEAKKMDVRDEVTSGKAQTPHRESQAEVKKEIRAVRWEMFYGVILSLGAAMPAAFIGVPALLSGFMAAPLIPAFGVPLALSVAAVSAAFMLWGFIGYLKAESRAATLSKMLPKKLSK